MKWLWSICGMLLAGKVENLRRVCYHATMSTTNPTWTGLGTNTSLLAGRRFTNRYGWHEHEHLKCECSFKIISQKGRALWRLTVLECDTVWSVKKRTYCFLLQCIKVTPKDGSRNFLRRSSKFLPGCTMLLFSRPLIFLVTAGITSNVTWKTCYFQ